MAFRGKRRRPSVAWLPLLGQGGQSSFSFIATTMGVDPTFALSTSIHSLVPDYPAEAGVATQLQSLADFQESGYRLRRIVGKFNVATDQRLGVEGVTIYPEIVLVGAGLIILRVDPINGAPLMAATPGYYSPLAINNARDPWIWRRTWVLSNDLADGGVVNTAASEFPRANAEYGSAWDGPHIDQKTARRVSAEERLFLVVSNQVPDIGITPNTASTIRYVYEARYLTSPLRVMGNKRNASR